LSVSFNEIFFPFSETAPDDFTSFVLYPQESQAEAIITTSLKKGIDNRCIRQGVGALQ